MDVTKQPYELLIRWDKDGKIAGAHVQWRYVIRDPEQPGQIVGETVTGAEPVSLDGEAAGFPLADILDQVAIDALAKANANAAMVEVLEERVDAAESKAAALETELAKRDVASEAAAA
jgi:hypothetical protein